MGFALAKKWLISVFFPFCLQRKDVDECTQYRICDYGQTCTNTFGSYECSCDQGYHAINAEKNKCEGECSLVERKALYMQTIEWIEQLILYLIFSGFLFLSFPGKYCKSLSSADFKNSCTVSDISPKECD